MIRTGKAGTLRFRKGLRFELLEARQLLAADLSNVFLFDGYEAVPNELLIRYAPNKASDSLRKFDLMPIEMSVVETIQTKAMQANDMGILERVSLGAGVDMKAAMEEIKKNPNVLYVEPNFIYRPTAVSNDTHYTNGNLWGVYSNDLPTAIGPPGTTNQFGTQAEKAWNDDIIGNSNVVIGVIDEGIQFNHPDLIDNMWLNPYEIAGDGIDNDGNGYIDDTRGWDFFNNDNSVYDGTSDDHGTHVAGTIGAKGGNDIGIAGVAWNVTMISVKFLGAGGGTVAGAVKSLDYLTDLKNRHGLNIVATSNSWGGGGYSQSLHDAIIRSANKEILFVAAAGNAASDNDTIPFYPATFNSSVGTSTEPAASYDSVISVASITNTGALSGFSCFGATTVDIGAPGSGIWSTVPSNTYAPYNGTSMATPHVSGAIALYASTKPVGTNAASIRQAILQSATPTASLSGKTVTGGRLNVYEAVRSIADMREYKSNDVPRGIVDNGKILSSINITDLGAIQDLNLTLDITHTWVSDLKATLIAPDGTRVNLFSRIGGNGDNFTRTTFDDDAAVSIFDGSSPYNGVFRPVQPLSALNLKQITGTWQLEIEDAASEDTGTLNAWSLFIISTAQNSAPTDIRVAKTEWLTEGNASSWEGFADDAMASVSNSATIKKEGSFSIQLETNGGFDAGVRYRAPAATWDLSQIDLVQFWVYGDTPSASGWQGNQPVIKLVSPEGSLTLTPKQQVMRNREWQWIEVPLPGNSLWERTVLGNFDIRKVSLFEIHQDTWDYGFVSYYDGLSLVDRDAVYLAEIPENAGPNALVGTFSTVDPDGNDTFTYTLIPGDGALDNNAFQVVGGQLRANSNFDFETKSVYTVRIRSTDQGGLFTEKIFLVKVLDLNEDIVLTGTSGNDAFVATYTGNGVQHQWNVTRNGAVLLNGSILSNSLVIQGLGGTDSLQFVGGGLNDVFQLDAGQMTTNGAITRFSSIENLRVLGGAGDDQLTMLSRAPEGVVRSFDGGLGIDSVRVISNANGLGYTNWQITGVGSGYIDSDYLTFSAVESLLGGTGNDNFIFGSAGRLTGRVLGGDGDDLLHFAARTTATTVNLQLGTATLIGGFGGIEQFIGSSTATVTDTLIGANSSTDWSINGANAGSLFSTSTGLILFSSFESLTGGTAADNFIFASAGSLSKALTGGTATGIIDSVNLSAKSGALDFQLNTTNSLPGTIGTYTGIEQITGNSVSGSKVTRVNNVATAWTVNASGQIVVGGVTYTGVGGIAGGPGTDTLTGPGVDSNWTINAANGGALAIPGTTIGFTAIENLTGGTASDSFAMLAGGSLTGNLNGGTGTVINSLSYETRTTGVTVNLSVNTAANATSIAGLTSNIQMVTGGSGNDVLTGQTSKATILIGLAGNDTLIGGSQRDMLFGGTGADIMQAGSGDDLLISGTTAFDTNRVALLQLYAEWTSTRTFAQRTANIWGNGTGTRSNGSTFLNNDSADGITDTVFGDSDVDSLTGGLGQDWFLALASEVTDLITTGTTPDRRNG